jgi:hypothetical protein
MCICIDINGVDVIRAARGTNVMMVTKTTMVSKATVATI